MIKTSTKIIYVCDNCKKEQKVDDPQESSIDSRYRDYGGNFSVDVKFRLPMNWDIFDFYGDKKLVCSEKCLLSEYDTKNKSFKLSATVKYAETLESYKAWNQKQMDNLKK